MAVTKNRIEKNLQRIRENIAEACRRAGRSPESVSIVAVTKAVDFETIKNTLDAGLCHLGESRAQELIERAGEMEAHLVRRRNALPEPIQWHMIGHLQRNKARSIIGVANMIHSVDSLRLAEEIDERAERAAQTVDALLQVNCGGESQKFGCAMGAGVHLGEMIDSMKQIRLRGLMTMAPLVDDPEQTRSVFARLRELFEEMQGLKIGGDGFQHLSMGMSQDYAVAVEEGATILRIGTALFE